MIFLIRVRSSPGTDPVRMLRLALKVLKRRFGFVCLSVQEEAAE